MGRKPKSISQDLARQLERISTNVRRLREARKFSQADIARRSKVSTTTVIEIETKPVRDIRLGTLVAIASALDVDVVRLLHGSDLRMPESDKALLLKASEDILRVTRKWTKKPN